MRGPEDKYAWTATVGEKGQIVISKQARELFEIRPGDTLLLLGDETRGIAIPPKGRLPGCLKRHFRRRTVGRIEKNCVLLYSRARTYKSDAPGGGQACGTRECGPVLFV